MKKQKDYLENYINANKMRSDIEDYYHSRGYPDVKVWLEKDVTSSGRTQWFIRSNIHFNANNIAFTTN